MARKARPSGRLRQRDTNVIANDLASLLSDPLPELSPVPQVRRHTPLISVEDNRRFDFLFTPKTLSGSRSFRLVDRLPPKKRSTVRTSGFSPGVLSFSAPSSIVRCVRRKRRKEVLFALRKTRKGAGSRTRRRNVWSSVSCK